MSVSFSQFVRLWKLFCGVLIAFWMLWAAAVFAQDQQEAVAASKMTPDAVTATLDDLQIMLVPLTASDLADLAAAWRDHLKNNLSKQAELNLSIKSADNEQGAKVREHLAEMVQEQRKITEKYTAVLDAWEKKGGAPDDIKPHRAYLGGLTAAAVQAIDPRTLILYAKDWLFSWEGGVGVAIKIGVLLLTIWGLMFVARMLKRASTRGLERVPNLSRLLKSFIVTCVYWATFVIGIVLVLGVFGVNVTPLFAVFGGLSFILGFALQETLGNLASGLMIMILKPFDTGDFILVAGTSGVVDEMSIVSTQIRTFDNQIIVVPNSKIWGDVITNVSASSERRVDLVFGIGYSDDTKHAIRILNEMVEAHPMCLKDPEPQILVGELGDSSVNILCRPWSKTEDYWEVYWDLTAQAKERFDEEGISIPFPQRDVHIIRDDSEATKTG